MLIVWGILTALLLYLEGLYHISGFGWSLSNPLFTIFVVLTWTSVETLIVGVLRGKLKKAAFFLFVWWAIVWTGAQTVYLHIFKQPLLWEAIFRGGQDALTNYWKEALTGLLEVSPWVIAMAFPGIVITLLVAKKQILLPDFGNMQVMRMLLALVVSFLACVIDFEAGKALDANYYENYKDFFDPLMVAEELGVHPTLQRDTLLGVLQLAEGQIRSFQAKHNQKEVPVAGNGDNTQPDQGNTVNVSPSPAPTKAPEKVQEPEVQEPEEQPEVFVPQPNVFSLDYETLTALADNKKQAWLADYIQNQEPTWTNEYTGIFEGYNLIFLTAEGFSPYAVREDLTPTLYHMVHSGFVFENYYVPLWQTSTSDGEYTNCTGLIPDGQFSMRKSADNLMPYTLAAYFNRDGLQSRAYHNNSLSYYDRHRSHPNLGYLFKSCNLGGLNPDEYGQYIFEMESSKRWPASDYEMMVSTMPEYVNDERFHVYYMTVSGHMNYNFRGNAMSAKNRDLVKDLELSENGQAYIACNIELDRALQYMLEQLKEAGQLEKTVIVVSADHYPYAMTAEQYEELAAGTDLNYGKNLFRNNLILWNAAFEEEPVVINKACCSVDLLPTLLNLFGYSYDSRMYAGRDIFSDAEGMVIFNDRSFVTDGVIYNRKTKDAVWLKDENGQLIVPAEEQDAYFAEKQQEVKDRYQFSAYILQENYYQDVEAARVQN